MTDALDRSMELARSDLVRALDPVPPPLAPIIQRRRRSRIVATAIVAIAFIGVAGALIGRSQSRNTLHTTARPGTAAHWTFQRLDTDLPWDGPPAHAARGNQLVVLAAAGTGLTGFTSIGDGPFRPITALPLGGGAIPASVAVAPFRSGWIAIVSVAKLGPDGLLDPVGELAQVYRSDDGVHWHVAPSGGLGGRPEISSIVEVPGGLVAVGTRTHGMPARPSGGPRTWRSVDGVHWTSDLLPPVAGELVQVWPIPLVSTGNRVLAAATFTDATAFWSSDDAGRTWDHLHPSNLSLLASVADLKADDGAIVFSGRPPLNGACPLDLIARSTDGGHTWTHGTESPPDDAVDGPGKSLATSRGRLLTFWNGKAIRAGAMNEDPTLFTSGDGLRWRQVSIPGGITAPPDSVLATPAGRVTIFSWVGGNIRTWTWPATAPLPESTVPRVGDSCS